MKHLWLILSPIILLVIPLTSFAEAPASLTVDFQNIEDYTDFSLHGLSEGRTLRAFKSELEPMLEKIAQKYIPAGQSLSITFTNIDMAGDIQPWRNPNNDDIRYIEDIYPPRLTFTYELVEANGDIIQSGEETTSDLSFQTDPAAHIHASSMSFFYEIELLKRWIRKAMPENKPSAGME